MLALLNRKPKSNTDTTLTRNGHRIQPDYSRSNIMANRMFHAFTRRTIIQYIHNIKSGFLDSVFFADSESLALLVFLRESGPVHAVS